MFLTLMRPSLVLFLVLWLKLLKDFLKVRCRLALLPFLISCLIWLDLVASLLLIKERILVIILLLHFLSLMLGSVLVLIFFFQAEDGIRDVTVTGVQTCALPILCFVDTQTKQEHEVRARVVVVCCATVESARLLLNSRSPQHPNGLANSNGIVGRYLHGHLGGGADIYLKELEGAPPFNQDGATDHVYIPRYNHLAQKKDYAGGWGFQVNFSGYMFPQHASRLAGYGGAYKERVKIGRAHV